MTDPIKPPVRVMLADDHNLVRESLAKTVAADPTFEVVCQAANGDEVLAQINGVRPDILVLDIAMPGKDGLTVAARVREETPDVRILFMTMHDDDAHLRQAMALDVAGFVSKNVGADEFLEALSTVASGEMYLSTDAMRRVAGMASGRTSDSAVDLSAREQDVLIALAEGHRPQEIADSLFLSVKTVKNHLSSVYFKLDVKTAAQAVAKAYRTGLVRPPSTPER